MLYTFVPCLTIKRFKDMKKILKADFPAWLSEDLNDLFRFSSYAKLTKEDVTVFNAKDDVLYMGPRKVKIKDIKPYGLFKFTLNGKYWVRDSYIRECKKYSVYPYEDVNKEKLIKGDKLVYTY